MALEPDLGEKSINWLVVLCSTEEEEEREIQPSHGKTQEEVDHYRSEAMDQGAYLNCPIAQWCI